MSGNPLARFAWTDKGKAIHITDDWERTRCGWPVTNEAVSADDVIYFGVCAKCRRDT